ncbi:hypothetical protein BV22DRAFT_1049626 [Leucogyrophana mollusca]|uniref:Uncharacterized protein n=1 Tax=Leucogyrophana mollusca TaxID=85980 RepID=A0ACB8B7B3_9AGAM|nr:hypothetical protein BV22DRAFT_1049626 [Leucogyrophana mollusca]
MSTVNSGIPGHDEDADEAQTAPSYEPSKIRSAWVSIGRRRPPNGTIKRHVHREDWRECHEHPIWEREYRCSAEIALELDVASTVLSLESDDWCSGSVNIVQSRDEGEIVRVIVKVGYHYEEALTQVSLFLLERTEGESGVGIFGSWWMELGLDKYTIEFDLTVVLPAGKHGKALCIKKFETDTPQFSYNLESFPDGVIFENISLKTERPITAGRIITDVGSSESSDAPIKGTFVTATALKLKTSNASINAEIKPLNAESAPATKLEVATTEKPITASVLLESQTASGTGGSFNISTTTSNSTSSLELYPSPISSHLGCPTTLTSGGPAPGQRDTMFGETVTQGQPAEQLPQMTGATGVGPEARG